MDFDFFNIFQVHIQKEYDSANAVAPTVSIYSWGSQHIMVIFGMFSPRRCLQPPNS
jgi:hypothetical protein